MNALGANMRDKIYELDKVDCFLLFVKYLICYDHYYYDRMNCCKIARVYILFLCKINLNLKMKIIRMILLRSE